MKMQTNDSESMGLRESSPKREIHSNTGLPQETRRRSHTPSHLTLTRTRKRTANIAQSEQKERINKDQKGNKGNPV